MIRDFAKLYFRERLMFKRVIRWLRATGIVAASATALSAQETVAGRWEGMLHRLRQRQSPLVAMNGSSGP